MFIQKFVGDKSFYRRIFAVMLPILVQNVITNFVNLLDNIFVGRVGTEQMSGVAIVNQLFFVFSIVIFGAISCAGIFTAQYYGKSDHEGVRNTFRVKIIIVSIIAAITTLLFCLFDDELIGLFLHEGSKDLDLELTLNYGKQYLAVIIFQLFPFAVCMSYNSTLRETGETLVPMKSGIAAVIVNSVLNYILIFGKLGVPALGVVGAAIATVISRVSEMLIVVIWTHKNTEKCPFIAAAYSSFKIPKDLIKNILTKGMPLLINEILWSSGMATLTQRYSTRGLDAVSAVNICSTASNLFYCAYMAFSTTIGIIIGQLLGAGLNERAKEENRKIIACSTALSVVVSLVFISLSTLIPEIYNTTDTVKELATKLLIISAVLIPVNCISHATYFTMRSGGKTFITFLFDSFYTWVVIVSTAFILTEYTSLDIVSIYLIVQSLDIIKATIGIILVEKGVWMNNIVDKIKK